MGKGDNSKATYDNLGNIQEKNKYKKALLSEIGSSREQINANDKQIERLQKLLDQSQQLQLMADNKIKQLENKNAD